MRRFIIFSIGIVVCLLASIEVSASVQFFVAPGHYRNLAPADLDQDFQNALGLPVSEIDFESFQPRARIDTLSVGPLTIDVNTNASSAADVFKGKYSYVRDPVTYSFLPNNPGTVNGNALLSGLLWDSGRPLFTPTLSFDFSQPLKGFGAWVFDNGLGEVNVFRMVATETDGTTWTSGILDSRNNFWHAIDGFLGAVSTDGLKRIEIISYTPNNQGGWRRSAQPFEVDNLQFALKPPKFDPVIPEPASMAIWSLIGAGCAGLHVWRRRRAASGSPSGPAERVPWPEESRAAIRQIIERGCGKS